MSYCVNCGVELDKSLKRCPLCNTPVINPNESTVSTADSPYPTEDIVIVVRKMRRLAAALVTIVLFVPLVLCPVCDVAVSDGVTWSVYVIVSVLCAWLIFVPPILMDQHRFIKSLWIDFFTSGIFLYVIDIISHPEKSFFFPIAFPVLLFIMAVMLIVFLLVKKLHVHTLSVTALCVVSAGVLGVLIECLIRQYTSVTFELIWSVPVVISCTAIGLILIVIRKLMAVNRIRDSFKKRMHI